MAEGMGKKVNLTQVGSDGGRIKEGETTVRTIVQYNRRQREEGISKLLQRDRRTAILRDI